MALTDKINNLLNNLIFSHYTLDIEEKGRRMIFLSFIFLMIIAFIIFGSFQIKRGSYLTGTLDFLLVIILIILNTILRFIKNGKPIYRFVTFLFILPLSYWIIIGTALGYGSLWGMLYPLVSFFLLGKKEGFFWTVICTCIITFILINPFSFLTFHTYSTLFISRYLVIFVMIIFFTYNYESIRGKYKSAMESEQEKLRLEKEKLAEAKEETDWVNRLLEAEIKEKELAEIELRKHHDQLENIVAQRTTEIQRKIHELELSEMRYRLLADNVDDLIWSTDLDLNFTFISPSVEKMFGYTVDEAMHLPHEKWTVPEWHKKMIEIFTEEMKIERAGKADPRRNAILEIQQIKKDGTIFWVEIKISFIRDHNGKAIGLAGINRDISDRVAALHEKEQMQQHLAQAQKMDALGTLVGGLAHEFNNFLGGILGSFNLLELVLENENLEKRLYIEECLQTGIDSSRRSADLIKQLLILSKKHEIILSPIDINKSISHVYELCKNSLPKSVELNFKGGDTPMIILGDMVQIEQVLLNFCINASHAMTIMIPENKKQGGVLTVKAEKIKSDSIIKESFPEQSDDVQSWIRIQISDTGTGMNNETKLRIFEPFFSTKEKNVGTGLGLAISYNLIKKHGGMVHVYSEPGSGSSFSIYFPVFESDTIIVSEDNTNNDIVKGHGTVLVIDDEEIILKVAKKFLEQCGYDVITAQGGDIGINIYSEKNSEISAVVTDFLMPGKSGLEVFKELKKINDSVKVLLSSGMLDNESREEAIKMGIKETLNKPYLGAELSAKIKSVIED